MEENKQKLIETLMKGRDSAHTLQKLNLDGSVLVKDLLTDILRSFSGGLSILNSSNSGEFTRVPASPHEGLTMVVDQTPDVRSGKKPGTGLKERRGCYKRRRTIDSRVKISTTIDDGYAWRKYGQKEILNSKSPRCYFRCTHKTFHGCKAVKQVQKLEDESNMFHITYFGHHTCPIPNNQSHHQAAILDFQDSKNQNFLSDSPSSITNIHTGPSVKQEVDSKDQSCTDVSDIMSSGNNGHSSSSLSWNEVFLGDDVGSCHEGASFMRFDHEDSCASTSPHDYLNMDLFNSGDHFLSDINLLDGSDIFPMVKLTSQIRYNL